MRNFSICKTEFNNHYLVSSSGPYHIFLSPVVLYFIENAGITDHENYPLPNQLIIGEHEYKEEEIKYNYSKYVFLKQHGLLAERDKPVPEKLSGYIHEDRVKWQLANLTQLVFEVTDACNLKCKYCGYGDFYTDYDARNNQYMTFETAKTIIDYLINLWETTLNHSLKRNVTFGFYGGEPLLNINLIKKIVEYIEHTSPSSINYRFSMTTNGMLLDKCMDYLVGEKFRLLISLDGNETNHSYRVTHDGSNSFNIVFKNVQLLKQKYPDFFKFNVNFNAVLHNRNSVNDIFTFINNEFGKNPSIPEISNSGIDPNKWEEFNRTYKNIREDLYQSENYDQLASKIELINPDFKSAVTFIHQYSGNVFRRYLDLFLNEKNKNLIPTGTCFPFERKMYVSVTGKILPCERIGHQFYLGKIIKNRVELDFGNIALKYNKYYEKLKKQCNHCYGYSSCRQCIFNLKNLEEEPVCYGFKSLEQIDIYVSNVLSFFEKNPETYKKSMDVTFQ